MKIDFELLDEMAIAGCSANVIIAVLKKQYERDDKKRKRDKEAAHLRRAGIRQRATGDDNERQSGPCVDDKARQEATLSDTPRARLFREGPQALIALGISESRGRGLIAQWLKITHDDVQLVTASIMKAVELSVADAPGYILAILKGKSNGANKPKDVRDLAFDLANDARNQELEKGIGRPPSSFRSS